MLLPTGSWTAATVTVSPLRWAGGKRWLFTRYRHIFAGHWSRYIEPFVGAGSVLFGLNPRAGVVCDANERLMATYEMLAVDARGVYARLAQHSLEHSPAYYYEMRTTPPHSGVDLAAWFLYLNRTAFGGLYRVNRRNEFNVPLGDSRRLPGSEAELVAAGRLLKRTELLCGDFSKTLERVTKGSLVYLDPPYALPAVGRDFRRYNEKVFDWSDQLRLARFAQQALERGAEIILSNAYHDAVRELFEPIGLEATVVERRASLSSTARASGRDEYMFLSPGLVERSIR